MGEKFYIAARFKNVKLVRELAQKLERRGLKNSCDWTKNQTPISINDLIEIGNKEYTGIVDCDFFIFVFPAGQSANTEFGVALALKKPIYIWDTAGTITDLVSTSPFYFKDGVIRLSGETNDFYEMIVKREKL